MENNLIDIVVNNKLVERIENTINLMDQMFDYIHNAEGVRIFENLSELIDGIDFILSKASYIDDSIDIKIFDYTLINMERAISIRDYVLFADILIYELKPVFKMWSCLLEVKI